MIAKKSVGAIVVFLLVSGSADAANVRFELKAQYFRPVEQSFLDIYGAGVRYGGEIDIGLWKGFDVWVGGGYFTREGELTFTKEKSKLKIIPIGLGLKYRWTRGVIGFYTGAGVSIFIYEETSPLGKVSQSREG